MRIFQACGELWAKEVREDSLPDLQLRVIEAICLAELHLPASEADIKLHDLVHLAYCTNVLPALGLPMPPSIDRLPACLTTHSVAPVEEEVATAEGMGGGELEEDYSEGNTDEEEEEEEAGGSRGAKRARR